MFKTWFSILSVGAVSLSVLAGCARPVPSQNPQNEAFSPNLLAQANQTNQPPFGNTLTNIRKVQSKPYNGKIRFVLLGDNRNSSPFTKGGNKVYAKVIQQINALNPDFAVNLGDFTFDALKPHWRDFERITSTAKVPYLTVVGNHDILFGRSYYENLYTPPNRETGLDDYTFDYGNTRFIMMDNANYNFTERQFQWLERQLQTNKKTMVFAHTPPGTGVWEHKLAPTPEVTRRWLGINAKYQVDLVGLGHIHLFDKRQIDGVNYVVSGGGGAPLDKRKGYGQGVYHVVEVTVDGDNISTRMVPIDTRIQTHGPTSYTDGLTAAEQQHAVGTQKHFPQDYIPPEEMNNDL